MNSPRSSDEAKALYTDIERTVREAVKDWMWTARAGVKAKIFYNNAEFDLLVDISAIKERFDDNADRKVELGQIIKRLVRDIDLDLDCAEKYDLRLFDGTKAGWAVDATLIGGDQEESDPMLDYYDEAHDLNMSDLVIQEIGNAVFPSPEEEE